MQHDRKSNRISKAFLMGLEDSFLDNFCVSHVSNFFFADGFRSLRFVVFSFGSNFSGFMGTAYGIEVEKTKQYIGGLSLAATGVFGHFI